MGKKLLADGTPVVESQPVTDPRCALVLAKKWIRQIFDFESSQEDDFCRGTTPSFTCSPAARQMVKTGNCLHQLSLIKERIDHLYSVLDQKGKQEVDAYFEFLEQLKCGRFAISSNSLPDYNMSELNSEDNSHSADPDQQQYWKNVDTIRRDSHGENTHLTKRGQNLSATSICRTQNLVLDSSSNPTKLGQTSSLDRFSPMQSRTLQKTTRRSKTKRRSAAAKVRRSKRRTERYLSKRFERERLCTSAVEDGHDKIQEHHSLDQMSYLSHHSSISKGVRFSRFSRRRQINND